MTALLEVRDLHVALDSPQGVVHAVDGVSFALDAGDTLALVGESGCGKTMTLRSIVQLLPSGGHVFGSVRFAGQELVGLPERRLNTLRGARVGMIFQEPMTALNPVMRIGDQIAEGPLAHRGLTGAQAHGLAVELLGKVGIPDPRRRARAYPHELSGGMRQRVVIAIAIACEPQLILCDEPTTALDVTIQDQILRLLAGLATELGMAVVFVTHDLAVVAQTCQRLCVMYAGQIVEQGPVARIFAEPHHPYTLGLLRSVPDIDGPKEELASIPGQPPSLVRPPRGCRFAPRCEFAEDRCRAAPVPLEELDPERAVACLNDERVAAEARRHPVLHDA
ncbi:MAG: ABC transporter ATP-binding protein [Candidatus Dormiibacterota bacterium]